MKPWSELTQVEKDERAARCDGWSQETAYEEEWDGECAEEYLLWYNHALNIDQDIAPSYTLPQNYERLKYKAIEKNGKAYIENLVRICYDHECAIIAEPDNIVQASVKTLEGE